MEDNCDFDERVLANDFFEMICRNQGMTIQDMLTCADDDDESENDATTSETPTTSTTVASETSSTEASSTEATTTTAEQSAPAETNGDQTDQDNSDSGGGSGSGRNDVALALGIGLGLGIPLLIGCGGAVLWLFWRTRRQDKNPEQTVPTTGEHGWQQGGAGGWEANKTGQRGVSHVPTVSEMSGTERWSEVPTMQELSPDTRRISELPST
jgi:hypothetical protein